MSDTFDHATDAEDQYDEAVDEGEARPRPLPTRRELIPDPAARRQAASLKRFFDDKAAKHGIW